MGFKCTIGSDGTLKYWALECSTGILVGKRAMVFFFILIIWLFIFSPTLQWCTFKLLVKIKRKYYKHFVGSHNGAKWIHYSHRIGCSRLPIGTDVPTKNIWRIFLVHDVFGWKKFRLVFQLFQLGCFSELSTRIRYEPVIHRMLGRILIRISGVSYLPVMDCWNIHILVAFWCKI